MNKAERIAEAINECATCYDISIYCNKTLAKIRAIESEVE